jgi:hypothetical protein
MAPPTQALRNLTRRLPPGPAEPATDTLRDPGQVSDLRQSRPSKAPASGN